MTAIPLGVSTYERLAAKTARILLINMYLEKDPTNLVDGYLRLQRPGLAPFATVGNGPIRATFKKDGVFNADILTVSGDKLYRVTEAGTATLLGNCPGTDFCQIAASPTRAIIVSGGIAFSTDGTSVTQVNMPDGQDVSSVAYINGYFILVQADSQRFYWLAPGDTDPDALSFASAENTPDNLIGAFHIFDELWMMGTASVEVWTPTGDTDLPFERINGRLYEKGCASRDTVTVTDNTLFWVGSDKIVYRGSDAPVRISDTGIEERIRLADTDDLSAWSFSLDGHLFYCLAIVGQGTFVLDAATNEWSQFTTYEATEWRVAVGCQSDGSLIVGGDRNTNNLWQLDPARSNDNGLLLVRELVGGVALAGNGIAVNNVEIFAATGQAPITGSASDPRFELCWSDNSGNTFTSWREIHLGKQGKYGTRAITRRLGWMKSPGRIFRMRMSDDTVFRVSYARMNEAMTT